MMENRIESKKPINFNKNPGRRKKKKSEKKIKVSGYFLWVVYQRINLTPHIHIPYCFFHDSERSILLFVKLHSPT